MVVQDKESEKDVFEREIIFQTVHLPSASHHTEMNIHCSLQFDSQHFAWSSPMVNRTAAPGLDIECQSHRILIPSAFQILRPSPPLPSTASSSTLGLGLGPFLPGLSLYPSSEARPGLLPTI